MNPSDENIRMRPYTKINAIVVKIHREVSVKTGLFYDVLDMVYDPVHSVIGYGIAHGGVSQIVRTQLTR